MASQRLGSKVILRYCPSWLDVAASNGLACSSSTKTNPRLLRCTLSEHNNGHVCFALTAHRRCVVMLQCIKDCPCVYLCSTEFVILMVHVKPAPRAGTKHEPGSSVNQMLVACNMSLVSDQMTVLVTAKGVARRKSSRDGFLICS